MLDAVPFMLSTYHIISDKIPGGLYSVTPFEDLAKHLADIYNSILHTLHEVMCKLLDQVLHCTKKRE
jgi:DNA gyrase inhibitor GyrI